MTSKIPASPLHVAIFPSLRTIQVMGGGEESVRHIKGSWSKSPEPHPIPPVSEFVERHIIGQRETYYINASHEGKPKWTINYIIESIEQETGYITPLYDVNLSELTLCIPYTFYSEYTFKNEDTWLDWQFRPYNFKPGTFERLKAEQWPAKELYKAFSETRQEIGKTLDNRIRKRWRDTLLMNVTPHESLGAQDIRNIWSTKPWALILKERRGDFDLMDLGEYKP